MGTYFEAEETEYTELVNNKEDGVVKAYAIEKGLRIPYVMLTMGSAPPLEVPQVLSGMVKQGNYRAEGTEKGHYNMYVNVEGNIVHMGLIEGARLKTLLTIRMFRDYEKYMCIKAGERIEGDLMYALCLKEL